MPTSVSIPAQVPASWSGRARHHRFSRGEQRTLLEEWASSGVSLAEFCRQRGLPYDVFKKARRRLAIERLVVPGPCIDLDHADLDEVEDTAPAPATPPRRVPLSAPWAPAIARIVIATWRGSGLRRAAFCRHYGIRLSRFDQWRRRLGDLIGPVSTAWSEHDARRVLDEWGQSGLNLTQFCCQRKITHSRLRSWAARLGLPAGIPQRTPVRTQTETLALLQTWATTDMPLTSFCAQRAVPYETLKKARQRFRITQVGSPGAGFIELVGVGESGRLLPPAAFIDLTPLVKPPPPAAEEWIDVATHGGTVRLRKGFDPVLLHDVLGQVATSC